jgi:hypothetical protein
MSAMRVTRDVGKGEAHNFAGRDVKAGEIFYRFTEPTYGCVDWTNGTALSEAEDEYPFFEFPADAVVPA